jgi:formylglycine-generating enzyme required for sulfatase activity
MHKSLIICLAITFTLLTSSFSPVMGEYFVLNTAITVFVQQEGIFSTKIEQFGPLGICDGTGYTVYGFEPQAYFETADTFENGTAIDELLIVASTPNGEELETTIVYLYAPSDGVSLSSGRVRGIDWNVPIPVIFDLYDGSSDAGFNRNESLARRIVSCGMPQIRRPSSPAEMSDILVEASNFITANADWQPAASTVGDVGADIVLVPAGCFEMGSSEQDIQIALEQCNAEIGNCQLEWFAKETPTTSICIENPFWIDQYEVTNVRYGSRGQFGGDNQPHDSVSWYEAQSYCQRLGGSLPTEAQWEYAAKGPNNLRYPWGNAFISSYAAHDDGSTNGSVSVGAYPRGASWVGALDLSGNLREWTSSLFAENNYPYDAEDGREDPNAIGQRSVRGGSWLTVPVSTRTTDRVGVDPNTRDWNIGFRCAYEVALR